MCLLRLFYGIPYTTTLILSQFPAGYQEILGKQAREPYAVSGYCNIEHNMARLAKNSAQIFDLGRLGYEGTFQCAIRPGKNV